MTEEQLREIEARVNAATRGPWTVKPVGTIIGHSHHAAVQKEGVLLDWICSMQVSNSPNWRNDAAFIARAREDVPALIAALRERGRSNESGEEEGEG